MSSEEAIWLESSAGKLFAIVHESKQAGTSRSCVVMLSAGQDSRVGPQRLYVRAARRWVKLGFTVIRLDLAGTGDSEAANREIHLDSHYTSDVDVGVRYAREGLKADTIFLVGLCAGARVATKYAAENACITGVVAWSCPTLSEGNTPYLNISGARRALLGRRIFTAAFWQSRLLYGRSELKEVWESLWGLISRAWGGKKEPYFLRCADKYLNANGAALFVYGELDKILCAEFEERFGSIRRSASNRQGYWVIPGAVHAFSSLDDQDALIDLSGRWMTSRLTNLL